MRTTAGIFSGMFFTIITICLANSYDLLAQEYLKVHEVYDFDPGDEYHYTKDKYEVVHSTNQKIYYEQYLINITILQKFYSADEDTVFYVRNVTKFNYLNNQISEVSDTVFFTNLNENASPIGLIYIKFLPDYCNGREMNEYSAGDSFGATLRRFVRGCGNTRNNSGNSGGGSSWSSDYNLFHYVKGEETWGNPVYVSIENLDKPVDLVLLRPNPASDIVYFDVRSTGQIECILFDETGRLIKHTNNKGHENWMDISGLKSGLYIFKVKQNDQERVAKLVIN